MMKKEKRFTQDKEIELKLKIMGKQKRLKLE